MKFFKEWLRRAFCKRELKQGKILILWRDVDDEVRGWTMSADSENGFHWMGKILDDAKVRKLEKITGMKGEGPNETPTQRKAL